jgi:ankyrin repeat protein
MEKELSMKRKISIVLLTVLCCVNVFSACASCEETFIKAVKQGDGQEVSKLIGNGVNLNCVDNSTGLTPLMIAASNGSKQVVETLIFNGAQPNLKVMEDKIGPGYYEGLTAIAFAVLGKHEDIALYLLNHGARFEFEDTDGATVLMGAARLNMRKLTLALLEKGIDVNKQAKNGYTALTIAVQFGNAEIVKLLMKHGANSHIRILDGKDKGLTPIDLAKALKNEEILRLLSNQKGKMK